MTPEQFWDDDCTLVIAYRGAWKLRQQEKNRWLWLQGLYIYEALCDVSPMLHAFAKKGTKPVPYMKEPIALSETEIKERKERDERRAYEQSIAETKEWMKRHNAKKEVRTDG